MNAIDEYGKILPLHIAVINGNEDLTERYLTLFFDDLNIKDISGRTPLHYAVSNNHCPIAQMLLHHGARIDDMTNSKLTPLHIAVSNHHKGMFDLLLQHRAKVNPVENFQNKTPLFMAVEYGCVDFARTLLDRGASIAEATVRGTTLLHVAVRLGHTDMVRLVLEYSSIDFLGIRANLEGKTAMELARDLQRYTIANLIKQKFDYEVMSLAKRLQAKQQNDLEIKALKKFMKLLLKKNRANNTVYSKRIKLTTSNASKGFSTSRSRRC